MPSAWVRDVLTAQNEEEEMLLRHVRGDCHNGAVCLLCQASARANQAELRLRSEKRTVESIISGDPIPLPTKADAVREYAAKMATARSPRPSLVEVVKAFHEAVPVHQHGLRLKTVIWMRETVEIPSKTAIRGYYDSIGGDWEAEASG